eukprot:TRINITY_DN16934_c0_g1_i1.p2 TRINITY_DN16934_c0_g1~~TRINITY_DN16934_c0_g1_i1.p2  ORF type:complete len:134 (+),score=22.20 TRINITY_DN16934_c0_g1_i1:387-788(+)
MTSMALGRKSSSFPCTSQLRRVPSQAQMKEQLTSHLRRMKTQVETQKVYSLDERLDSGVHRVFDPAPPEHDNNSNVQAQIQPGSLEHYWGPFDLEDGVREMICERGFLESLQEAPTIGSVSYTHLTLPTKRIV